MGDGGIHAGGDINRKGDVWLVCRQISAENVPSAAGGEDRRNEAVGEKGLPQYWIEQVVRTCRLEPKEYRQVEGIFMRTARPKHQVRALGT